MKILVTGAAGFIGSHMAQSLAILGHAVVGIDNFSNYYDRSLKEQNRRDIESRGVHFIEADLVDKLEGILPNDIEVIYHFAAQPGISASTPFSLYERNNIIATQNVLDWSLSLENPLKMFVNISTSSVYGLEATSTEDIAAQPASDYGVTKLAAEQLILAAARMNRLKACSIRLYSVYGPRERPEKLYTKLIKAILEKKEFPLYEGSEKHLRSFTYVGDIIEGLAQILNNLDSCEGQIINLGNNAVYSTAQGIELVQELLGKKALLKTIPNRVGDQLKTAANIQKAKRILNYSPSTPFKKGLELQIAWYKESNL